MSDDPRLAFPDWAKTPVDRALFYTMTARRLEMAVDFDTIPNDVRDVLFPVPRCPHCGEPI